MEIGLRRKKSADKGEGEVWDTSDGVEIKKSEETKLDDLDLADSDREDYHNNVDILFVVDTTGSMGSYI